MMPSVERTGFRMSIAVYPGSFDPITLGHLNIIKRASKVFDRVIVCVMVNSTKHYLFPIEERMELLRTVLVDLPNVEIDHSEGLVAAYCERRNSGVLVKGLRAISDYEAEVQMAIINRKLNPNLDTVFFPANEKYTYISSSTVKEMARYGADLTEFLPREIVEIVMEKYRGVKAHGN